MSNSNDKLKNSKRRYADQLAIEKQMQLAKNYGYHKLSSTMSRLPFMLQPHRHHKTKIFNCGDSKCYMCGNPRKFFGEETVQEKKHKQEKYYKDSN
jgi:hypothetical protein